MAGQKRVVKMYLVQGLLNNVDIKGQLVVSFNN